ncbi:MAG: serine/threonine-protein kinase [Myxococcota bacterium]
MLEPGATIDGYVIEAEIGVGSTSVVYRVRKAGRSRRFALKVLSLRHPEVLMRMRREGELMAKLDHPNLVRVFDVVEVDTRMGLVMDWVAGPSLERWLSQRGPVPFEVRHQLAEGIVSGMAHAHGRGLVHRDLKPANVLLDLRDGRPPVPRIADFGLAKMVGDPQRPSHTRTGHALGTPRYMAPEQIRSAKHVDARADVFSLGCVLYEIYCRRVAFPQPDMLSVFNAVCNGEFDDPGSDPDVPPEVARAIRTALSVDPEDRPRHAAALLEQVWSPADVQTEVFSRRKRTPAPEPARRVQPPHRSPPWWTGAAAVGFGSLIGAGVAIGLLVLVMMALWWVN